MTLKQINFRGHVFEVEVLSNEMYDYLERADRERKNADLIETNRSICFTDKTLRSFTFDKDDQALPELSAKAHDYVKRFPHHLTEGKGLLLYGSVGVGKTFMAACIANALLDECYSCYMTTFARISNKLQATWEKQDVIDNLMQYDLLIIDDLATERDTEYMNEVVISVIDERYRSGKPIIITTNLTSDDLLHPADISKNRIYSRLFEMCQPIHVDGKDRRKEKLRLILENEQQTS